MAQFQRSQFPGLTWVMTAGTIVLLGACQKPQAKQQTQAPAAAPADQIALSATSSATLPVPTVPQLTGEQLPTIPIQGLQPTTATPNPKAQATPRVNRRDPFSSGTLPSILKIKSKPANAKAAARKTATKKSPTAAKKTAVAKANAKRVATKKAVQKPRIPRFPQAVTVAASRPVAPIAVQPPITVQQMPTIAVAPPAPKNVGVPAAVLAPKSSTTPTLTAPPKQSLAEAIAITGVVQTNGRIMVIAKSPNERSTRYVQTGDSIGGQVRVKSIKMQGSGEPLVILEQNGVEVTKSIGPIR
ncbi:hypothetical protein IQ266_20590 [filamentous cyanobacterium LEGE 11480]|uniref:Uncharacterized protein n=1 Tax=Romeriopsis navalis LEGE 11480 TaxID=2777977 RepID=A0A928VSF5_9CYAN|nr:hypothetical protein [Romeriopsis navalis]MBE9032141.1 hypothetical protein [Romeriopsis navalis LEGE 11480]